MTSVLVAHEQPCDRKSLFMYTPWELTV